MHVARRWDAEWVTRVSSWRRRVAAGEAGELVPRELRSTHGPRGSMRAARGLVRTGFGHLVSVGCAIKGNGVSASSRIAQPFWRRPHHPSHGPGGAQVVLGLQRALLVPRGQQVGTAGFWYLL
jgi:hypothetical protein